MLVEMLLATTAADGWQSGPVKPSIHPSLPSPNVPLPIPDPMPISEPTLSLPLPADPLPGAEP